MNGNLKTITLITLAIIAIFFSSTYKFSKNVSDYKCLSKSRNNTVKSLHLEERQSYYHFRIIIYRWWMKIWEQSEGEVWNGGPQNVLPIIFYENNLGTVQFRSDDGVLEGYLDGKSKKFALREKGVTVRGVCINIPELPS